MNTKLELLKMKIDAQSNECKFYANIITINGYGHNEMINRYDDAQRRLNVLIEEYEDILLEQTCIEPF